MGIINPLHILGSRKEKIAEIARRSPIIPRLSTIFLTIKIKVRLSHSTLSLCCRLLKSLFKNKRSQIMKHTQTDATGGSKQQRDLWNAHKARADIKVKLSRNGICCMQNRSSLHKIPMLEGIDHCYFSARGVLGVLWVKRIWRKLTWKLVLLSKAGGRHVHSSLLIGLSISSVEILLMRPLLWVCFHGKTNLKN